MKEREHIMRLFAERFTLRFNEIEKLTKLRSNALAYHLTKLREEGLLTKRGETYSLSAKGQRQLPTISAPHQGPIAVVLVAPLRNEKILLGKRSKRPYKSRWALIGGKIHFEETIEQACARKLGEVGVSATFARSHAIVHEHVEEDGELKHAFLHFFVSANVSSVRKCTLEHYDELRWFSVNTLEKYDVIPSDLWLIKKQLSKRASVKNVLMQERDGELGNFRLS